MGVWGKIVCNPEKREYHQALWTSLELLEQRQIKDGIRIFIKKDYGKDFGCDYCPKRDVKYYWSDDGYSFYFCSKRCMRGHDNASGGYTVRFYKIVNKKEENDEFNTISQDIINKVLAEKSPDKEKHHKCPKCGSGSISILHGDVHCNHCFKLLSYSCNCICHNNHIHHCRNCNRN